MANIVSSTYTTETPQVDGRFQVDEENVDVSGAVRFQTWLAAPGDHPATALVTHAAAMGRGLHDGEIAANLAAIEAQGAAAQVTNVFGPVVDNVAAVQSAFPTTNGGKASMVADDLVAQFDMVLKADSGMTAAQVSALRALPTLQQRPTALAGVAG